MQRILRSEKDHSSLPERCAIHGCMVRLLVSCGTAMLCFGTHIIFNTITSRCGNSGPKARTIRRHMATFTSKNVHQISLYIYSSEALMSRS